MNEKTIDNFVDILFNFDMKELENETKFLENYKKLQQENQQLKEQQKEFIKYLEEEKDRLARECSQIYEDSLGKTRLVNEDIFNEINEVLSKYKEIIGSDVK